jgi:hypothetical protein
MPHGMRVLADVNPLNWAVVAARVATSSDPDWGLVASRAGFLAALLALSLAFAGVPVLPTVGVRGRHPTAPSVRVSTRATSTRTARAPCSTRMAVKRSTM